MATFNIHNASYARSRSGLMIATTQVNEYIDKIMTIVAHKDETYQNFRQTVRDNWQGNDMPDFLDEVEIERNNFWLYLRDNIKKSFDGESGILRQDLEEFVSDQSKIDVTRK